MSDSSSVRFSRLSGLSTLEVWLLALPIMLGCGPCHVNRNSGMRGTKNNVITLYPRPTTREAKSLLKITQEYMRQWFRNKTLVVGLCLTIYIRGGDILRPTFKQTLKSINQARLELTCQENAVVSGMFSINSPSPHHLHTTRKRGVDSRHCSEALPPKSDKMEPTGIQHAVIDNRFVAFKLPVTSRDWLTPRKKSRPHGVRWHGLHLFSGGWTRAMVPPALTGKRPQPTLEYLGRRLIDYSSRQPQACHMDAIHHSDQESQGNLK